MDCDKFEATMLDELYGELDELTLAASKRHATGCARCATMLAGLRATRKLVTLPVLLPSEGFESRLLAAVAEAEPPKLRLAEIISLAGRWAMRPQTAMAAVFLVIIGTTSVVVSRKVPKTSYSASSSFTVTENGAPAAAATAVPPPAAAPAVDFPQEAHGTAPMAHVLPPQKSAAAESAFGGVDDHMSKSAGRAAAGGGSLGDLGAVSRSEPKGAPRGLDEQQAAPRAQAFSPPPPPAAPAAGPVLKDDDGFDAAKQRYRDGDYPGAVQSFDALAQSGDAKAALWAARSARDGAGGCSTAIPRYDRLAQAGWGTESGYDATYEAAQCYARVGQADAARTRFQRLLTVPSYAARAQSGINATSAVAARKAMSKPAAIAPNATAVAPASPPPAPAVQ